MRKLVSTLFALVCSACLICNLASTVPYAFAYYALNPVGIDLSSIRTTVKVGETTTVACKLSPESEKQLPGCGMQECPQVCDGLTTPGGVVGGCQNEKGWCTCNGTTYRDYYAKVSISSSAPNVARGQYNNGVITISGKSAGTATLKIKVTLSKHLDATKSLEVTVSKNGNNGNGVNTGSNTGSGNASSGSITKQTPKGKNGVSASSSTSGNLNANAGSTTQSRTIDGLSSSGSSVGSEAENTTSASELSVVPTNTDKQKSNIGAVIAIIAITVLLIVAAAVVRWFIWKRQHQNNVDIEAETSNNNISDNNLGDDK